MTQSAETQRREGREDQKAGAGEAVRPSLAELRERLRATAPRGWAKRLTTGIAAVDALLGGGVPEGRVVEFLGGAASCATSLAVQVLAAATRRGEVVAYIDGADAFDPRSVAGAGLALERTLWVRPKTLKDALAATDLVLGAGGFGVVALDLFLRNMHHNRRRLNGTGEICAVERSLEVASRQCRAGTEDTEEDTEEELCGAPHGARENAFSVFPRFVALSDSRGEASSFFRLSRAAERSKTTLIVIAERHVAGTFAALALSCGRTGVTIERSRTLAPGRAVRVDFKPPRIQ